MVNIDRTQKSVIEKEIRERLSKERVGEVIQVSEHTESGDDTNYECEVSIDGGIDQVKAKVLGPHAREIGVPKVGDTVLVGFFGGEADVPYVIGRVSTVTNRPPIGKAGIVRESYEGGDSPAGPGDIYLTKYTSYDLDVSQPQESEPNPEQTLVRLAKTDDPSADPTTDSAQPVAIEFYDDPANDEGYVSVEINKVDGADSDNAWGMKFNIKTGEMIISDGSNFGIESDGSGNFIWSHKSINFQEESGSTGSIRL